MPFTPPRPENKSCKDKTKRPFLLLEVLIALALVVLCLLPLIAPHVWMVQSEKRLFYEIEADRIDGILYAQIVELLYQNLIPWEVLTDKNMYPFPAENLEASLVPPEFPYEISYSFGTKQKKGKADQQILTLLQTTIHMTPLDDRKPLRFEHLLFIDRNPAKTVNAPETNGSAETP